MGKYSKIKGQLISKNVIKKVGETISKKKLGKLSKNDRNIGKRNYVRIENHIFIKTTISIFKYVLLTRIHIC